MSREEIRNLLMANMFDGNDAGTVTMKVSHLLDTVTDIIMERPVEDRFMLVQDAPNLTEFDKGPNSA